MTTPDDHPIKKLLPHSDEAERGLICSFMRDPNWVGALCAEHKISQDHFVLHLPRLLFPILQSLWSDSKPLDFITISNLLRVAGKLEEAGGAYAITDISNYIGTAKNAESYLDTLEDLRIIRKTHLICAEIAEEAREKTSGGMDLVSDLQDRLGALVVERKASREWKDVVMEAVDSIEKGEEGLADICTGITSLDDLVRMKRSNFIVICGEAKGGKTALAGTILNHASVHDSKRCAVMSLEMRDSEVAKRLISTNGRVNLRMMGRTPSEHDMLAVSRGAMAIMGADITCEEHRDLPAIVARLRQIHMKKPLDLIVIDYLQLIEMNGVKKGNNRQEEVAFVSRTCKRMAVELNCVVIGLSQLNDDGKLRESRAIGQDANAVIAIDSHEDGSRAIRVVCQRSGPSNEIADAQWLPQFSRFEDKL